jgi:hypothetical protein
MSKIVALRLLACASITVSGMLPPRRTVATWKLALLIDMDNIDLGHS